MSRTAARAVSARLQAGMPRAAAAWGRGSLMAVLLTLSLVLWGEGAPGNLERFALDHEVFTD